jgi:hypothetical protein
MVTSNIVLLKFIDTNYLYWSKRVQPIFIIKYLWEFVTEGYGFPSDEEYKESDVNGKQTLKELIMKYNEALSLIGSAIDEYVFPRINAA